MSKQSPTSNRAAEINNLHAEVCEGVKTCLLKAIRIGELLVAQKKQCGHGNWSAWIKANLTFSQTQAKKYIRCYYNREQLNRPSTGVLTIDEFSRATAKPTKEEIADAEEEIKERMADIVRQIRALSAEAQELRIQREKEVIEIPADEIEFEEIDIDGIAEKRANEIMQTEEKELEELAGQELMEEIPPQALLQIANQQWESTCKHFWKYDRQSLAKVMVAMLYRKYPQLQKINLE